MPNPIKEIDMNKIDADLICKLLNDMLSGNPEIKKEIVSRVPVSSLTALNTNVNCTDLGDDKYDSSPLGFINALSDEVIGMLTVGDTTVFCTVKNHKSVVKSYIKSKEANA